MNEYIVNKQQRPRPIRFLREIYFRVFDCLRSFYWMVFKPETVGVKTFVASGNKILLVRIGYGHRGWVLPGGGVSRGESFKAAAARELREETGLKLDNLKFIKSLRYQKKYHTDMVHYFHTDVSRCLDLLIDDQEIIAAGWFSIDSLPKDRSPRLDETVEMYKNWKYGV